ncbi:uncharacterized protein M421DRAFT_394557 [Didymella exigua CBS 183.55]|uniref:Alcohol dehydrogenase-like C-terminal domain-containing protein n=1 Tax=Didymella exigua CBS 183.55 TaxID=1150837 RepID=A0A6A5RF46_9PLEO|nr:uncharacterized protein M421DRAFT_394557 [Didymella exigua CBS 183.55]KAF1926921.1 hypothetical protein M421DRAFT_394557 [Didymella exigua CBS 183.55]
MAAKNMGVGQIIAVDIVQEQLQMAKELGAIDAIKKALKSGTGLTFAIDCTGVLRVIENMLACLSVVTGDCGYYWGSTARCEDFHLPTDVLVE